MIELEEERFEWIPGPREFRRVETVDTLFELRPLRLDVSQQRLKDGWQLIASHPTEENAQLFVLDLWSRVIRVSPNVG